MKKKLLVMSVDGMVSEDVIKLKKLPNYKRYMENACEIRRVRSIYPTITYPVHTSIATGVYPDKHGVIANMPNLFTHRGKLPWLWFHDAVKCDDIFTAAKKAGLTTAAVFWPVTGNHPDIDYLIDEYWTQNEDDTLHNAFERTGSNKQVLEIVDKYAPMMRERKHPMCDNFIVNCTCDMIRKFKPDLTMIHPAQLDAYRHDNGVFNEKVDEGILETDRWIGQLVEAMQCAGTYEDTNFVIVSDHGLIDIKRIINLNVLLVENGLIDLDDEGNVKDWRAYIKSGGACAWAYIKDQEDKSTYDKLYKILKMAEREQVFGIERIYTADEAENEERVSEDFVFMLETDGYTAFGSSAVRPLVKDFDLTDYRYGRATHGHHPDKGPQPIFIGKGPSFRENVIIERRPIVDETATFAKLLNLEMNNIDGSVIEEILIE